MTQRNVRRDCPHRKIATPRPAASSACLRCLATGDTWVHLRWCLTCGEVGCCDESKNKHATQHYHATGHPLIQALDQPEPWVYCYVDEVVMPA